ncbi:hypothetical protein BOX15_Mlig016869g1 [Macrostomum lignano]|uniref:Uncharacterized protein n=1 Tax=Macrostomum lignano TaxID=282301 RepID=A0A267DD79_9PLAT|nr:hypothetical protein BOX15_Mlig023070g2 [Macrostomum lignano]PAA59602.1 hypothetical protein BOX15_Mlig016869g1 [Macrostomum lignano]
MSALSATARYQFIYALPSRLQAPAEQPAAAAAAAATVAMIGRRHQFCCRDGCSNLAVSDPRWDWEYCSADCCLAHVDEVRCLFVELNSSGDMN